MTDAVLSIGGNLGDRLAALQSVIDGLGGRVRAISPIYETAAWGGVEQDDFLNAIVLVSDPAFEPMDWLRVAHQLERDAGRVRDVRWGPRTLDVDIVDCDGIVSPDPVLTLPHPRAHERAFVLVPWLAVEPNALLSVAGQRVPVAALVAHLPADEIAGVRRTDFHLSEVAE
jgi:2-amino-4-hydroxy-6-hydroxymethyldihydropteridine diphosphokinase